MIQIKRDGKLIHLVHPEFRIQITEEADFVHLLVETADSVNQIDVYDSGDRIPMEDGMTLEVRWANFPENEYTED